MLREDDNDEENIDLSNVVLSHYQLSKIREQNLELEEQSAEYKLEGTTAVGTAKSNDAIVERPCQTVGFCQGNF
jgi:type I restriction enzyme R subunit